jgi:hypothetical protein
MLTWKKFFEVVAFVVVFVVPVILYLMEKAGASLTWIFVVGWLSILAAALYLVLSIPWVWEQVPLPMRVWRVSLVSVVALMSVGYGAIKIWPNATVKESKPAEKIEAPQPHEVEEKSASSPRETAEAHGTEAKGESPKSKPPHSTPNEQPPQTIIEIGPAYGNIKERALALADKIMDDLYRHGWREGDPRIPPQSFLVHHMPPVKAQEDVLKWEQARAGHFRLIEFDKVLAIRNEFAELHYHDERLDDFFKYQGMIEDANKQMAAIGRKQNDILISPLDIEGVCERLRVLADQVKPIAQEPQKPILVIEELSATQIRAMSLRDARNPVLPEGAYDRGYVIGKGADMELLFYNFRNTGKFTAKGIAHYQSVSTIAQPVEDIPVTPSEGGTEVLVPGQFMTRSIQVPKGTFVTGQPNEERRLRVRLVVTYLGQPPDTNTYFYKVTLIAFRCENLSQMNSGVGNVRIDSIDEGILGSSRQVETLLH